MQRVAAFAADEKFQLARRLLHVRAEGLQSFSTATFHASERRSYWHDVSPTVSAAFSYATRRDRGRIARLS